MHIGKGIRETSTTVASVCVLGTASAKRVFLGQRQASQARPLEGDFSAYFTQHDGIGFPEEIESQGVEVRGIGEAIARDLGKGTLGSASTYAGGEAKRRRRSEEMVRFYDSYL